jgi:hypothetical protein
MIMNDRSMLAKDKCDRRLVGQGKQSAADFMADGSLCKTSRDLRLPSEGGRCRNAPEGRIDLEGDRTRRDENIILACADRLIAVGGFGLGANQPSVDDTRECGIPVSRMRHSRKPAAASSK